MSTVNIQEFQITVGAKQVASSRGEFGSIAPLAVGRLFTMGELRLVADRVNIDFAQFRCFAMGADAEMREIRNELAKYIRNGIERAAHKVAFDIANQMTGLSE